MAAAATVVDHHNHLRLNSLPLIDVRLLSHSELLSLSRCSASSTTTASATTTIHFDDEDQDSTPKIDASVFNESAGSRKQTFSRLRLAPRNSSPLRPQIPPPPPASAAKPPLDEENSQVISLLKSLLHIHSDSDSSTVDDRLFPVPVKFEKTPNTNAYIHPQNIPVELVSCSETKRKRGRPRKDDNGTSRWVIASGSKVNENVELTMLTSSIISQDMTATKPKRGRPRKIKSENGSLNVNCLDKVLVSPVGSSSSVNVCSETTEKRKRGRPRKVAIASGGEIDRIGRVGDDNSQNVSLSNGGGVTCETRKRKPGRPRKEESMRGGGGGIENELENRNGVVVNGVDPTEEIQKGNELLGFLRGSNGGDW